MICPKDLKTCSDSLCRGGECFYLGGEPTLDTCSDCGSLSDEINMGLCEECEINIENNSWEWQ